MAMQLRSVFSAILFLALMTVPAALPLPAQEAPRPNGAQTPAAQETLDTPFTYDVTRVNVLFTVTDKRGRFVTDLVQNDFQVLENKKPQNILEFTAESDLPLRIAILVDTSNSIRERFRFEQEAAIQFLSKVLRPGQDHAIIVGFDSVPNPDELTGDLEVLSKSLRDMRPGGGTSCTTLFSIPAGIVLARISPCTSSAMPWSFSLTATIRRALRPGIRHWRLPRKPTS